MISNKKCKENQKVFQKLKKIFKLNNPNKI